jgi:hypothetical protein
MISLDGVNKGMGRFESRLPNGRRYRVAARIRNAIAGCPTSTVEQTVRVTPALAARTVSLAPRPCGTLAVGVRGVPKGGQAVYRVTSRDGAAFSGELPIAGGPLVLPVGVYDVLVEAPGSACAQYREEVRVSDRPVLVRPTLLCGAG